MFWVTCKEIESVDKRGFRNIFNSESIQASQEVKTYLLWLFTNGQTQEEATFMFLLGSVLGGYPRM